jgi:glycosyltransferase involved in cell wall biosynthesis
MRIAYLSTFYPFRGGIAQFNTSLFRELQKQHDVNAFTFKRQYPNLLFPGKTQYLSKNEDGNLIQDVQLLDSINPFSYLTTAGGINAFKPDILIMKYWISFFGPSLGTTAKLLNKNVKRITILDNVISREKRFFDKAFTKFFLNQNDGFVVMSESVKNDLISLKPDAKFIKMEHPLYDHFGDKINREEASRQLNLSPDKKTLLFFGFIRDYKGLDILIKAFNFLDASYQLVIAGETYGSFKKYRLLIDSNKNKERIHVFNDYINDAKVPAFFSAADVCVLPYKYTTQSGIAALAYHFDLPLIATDVGGLKESIGSKGTGIIVSQCKPELIAQAVEDYFNKKLSGKFIPNIKKVKQELSWKKFADLLIEFSGNL